jgi:alpha/beta superfamily hydrolase
MRGWLDGVRLVDAGQFLERMTTIVLPDDAVLEALFHRGEKRPAVVIVPGVPGGGGNMEAPVVTELAWAIAQRGHPTLRFNFRGVGASTGTLDLPSLLLGDESSIFTLLSPMADDLVRVIERQRENIESGPVVVVGYAIGAIVAVLASQRTRVEALSLIAPPLDLFGQVHRHSEPRPAHTTPTCLFVASDAASSLAMTELEIPDRIQVLPIPGADAGFSRGLAALGARVADVIDDRRPNWIDR